MYDFMFSSDVAGRSLSLSAELILGRRPGSWVACHRAGGMPEALAERSQGSAGWEQYHSAG